MDRCFADICQVLDDVQSVVGPLPTDYTVFDLETTGFSRDHDVVVELGYAVIRGCRAIAAGGCRLDWTRHPAINQYWLQDALSRVKHVIEYTRTGTPTGRKFNITYEHLQHGEPPEAALAEYCGLLSDCIQRNELVVGHNCWNFDRPMLESVRSRYTPAISAIPWHDNAIFDTGLLEAASQMGARGLRWPGESLGHFYQRLRRPGGGINWSLDRHCVPKYNLANRHNLDMQEAHANPFDCLVTHYLLESWREIYMTYRQAAPSLR